MAEFDPVSYSKANKVAAQLADVVSQLAQTENELTSTVTIKSERIKPMVTFIDDDTRSSVWTRLRPIFEDKNVPCSVAAITGRIGNDTFLTWEQLEYLQNELGWEVLGHAVSNVRLGEIDDYETLNYEIVTGCLNVLKDRGFNVDGFVYPGGSSHYASREVTKKHYKYAFAGLGINGDNLLDTMQIKRIALGSFTDANPTINGNSEQNTLAYYQACVDWAVDNNAWLVFMTHIQAQDVSQDTILSQVIDYIQSLDVDIVTPRDGYKVHGNRFFAGDVETGTYTIVDKKNNFINSGGLRLIKLKENEKDPDDIITTYEENSITVMRSTSDKLPQRGILITYYMYNRPFQDSLTANWQELWTGYGKRKYFRSVETDSRGNVWGEWEEYITTANISEHTSGGGNQFQKVRLTVPEIVVPAGDFAFVDVDLAGVKPTNTLIINGVPTWGFTPGVFANCFVTVKDKVRIVVHNMDTQPRTISEREWLFSYTIVS